MSINRVFLVGNLTHNPELRTTPNGITVLTFSIAVNDRRKNATTGEWYDYPNYVNCIMFGARAESVSRFIRKGSKVAIDGKLHYSAWEQDGSRRQKIEVTVENIEFMQQKSGDQASSAVSTQNQQSGLYEEDLPF